MCIRDRDIFSHFGDVFGEGSPFESFFGGSGGRGGRRVNRGCLLYTSDAADERSSVDLGGRRIIKKKKREHIGSWGHVK